MRHFLLGLLVPVDASEHQALVLLDGAWPAFDQHHVRQVSRRHSQVGNEAEAAQVVLLGVHVYFELQVGLSQRFHTEQGGTALVVGDVTLVLALHLGLLLVARELVGLVALEVVFQAHFDDALHLVLHAGGVGDGFLAQHFHVVAQLQLGQGRRQQAKLDALRLVLLFLYALHFAYPLFLFGRQVDRNKHLVDVFNVVILDGHWVLHVVGDFLRIYVLSYFVPALALFPEDGRVPPLQLGNGV